MMRKIGAFHAGALALGLALVAFPTRTKAADASWMAGQYGVSFHFFSWFYPGTSFDQAIENFDVDAYANQVKASGAKWVVFGVQQNFKTLPALNANYEILAGRYAWEYSSSSGRDLINDLGVALNAKGIKLILYWMAGGYFTKDPEADGIAAKLGWDTVSQKATPLFIKNTSSILEEFSRRYKTKVSGWWLDACNGFFGFTDPANDFTPMVNAMRAGNPAANIALNQGVETFTKIHPGVDFTTGESRDFNHLPPASGTGLINGIQWSMTSFLAPKNPAQDGGVSGWGLPGVRYRDSLQTLVGFAQTVLARKGALTFDIFTNLDGTIDPPQFRELLEMRQAIHKDTSLAAVGLLAGKKHGRNSGGSVMRFSSGGRDGGKCAAGMGFQVHAAGSEIRDGLGRGAMPIAENNPRGE